MASRAEGTFEIYRAKVRNMNRGETTASPKFFIPVRGHSSGAASPWGVWYSVPDAQAVPSGRSTLRSYAANTRGDIVIRPGDVQASAQELRAFGIVVTETVFFQRFTEPEPPPPPAPPPAPPAGPKCFLATAAMGSPLSPEVDALRRFRDERLAGPVGLRFVVGYYAVSPPIAAAVSRSSRLARLVRPLIRALARVVR